MNLRNFQLPGEGQYGGLIRGSTPFYAACCLQCGVVKLYRGRPLRIPRECPKNGEAHLCIRVWSCQDCKALVIYPLNRGNVARCNRRGMGHHDPAPIFEAPAGSTEASAFRLRRNPPKSLRRDPNTGRFPE